MYIEANERFRLPQDASRDVIMIGPGTGVAPFRGFVHERSAVGAGRTVVLRCTPTPFAVSLYQLEWAGALKASTLYRSISAFSRDTAERVYVQQRLRDQGRDVQCVADGGAHLYAQALSPWQVGACRLRGDRVIEILRHTFAADEYLSELQRSGCRQESGMCVLMSWKLPSPVETLKRDSRGLRGTLRDSLDDAVTGALRESDAQLLKFHGSYQQDAAICARAPSAEARAGVAEAMIRTRLPGGVATSAQWLRRMRSPPAMVITRCA